MSKKGGGGDHLGKTVAEMVIVEAIEDWNRAEGGVVDGSCRLVRGTVNKDEMTVVGAVERREWIEKT